MSPSTPWMRTPRAGPRMRSHETLDRARLRGRTRRLLGEHELERLRDGDVPLSDRAMRCFESLRPSAFAVALSSVSSGFTWRRRSSRSSISRPIFAEVFCSSTRIHCRILCRARPVRTCASQSRLGFARGRRHDLHRVRASELARQRRDAAIHLRALAVDAHLGVHREREVDRRRALRAAGSRRPWA